MPLNIPTSLLPWIALAALLLVVFVVALVLLRRRRQPRSAMVTILWNGRSLTIPRSIYESLLSYLTPAQRRLITRVERARQNNQQITPEADRAYDAFIASAIRELIFHEPGLAAWFVNR
jgi:hypothetical protein